jgi:uncharacterized lipoprotein YajG
MKSLASHFRIASLSAILTLAACASTPAVVTVTPPAGFDFADLQGAA